MAKNKIILDVEVNDKGGTKKLGVESKKTAKNLDNLGNSSRTADRNIKGAAQASSGASKNFSKMAQGAGGLVGVYATLAATAFAVSAAFQFLKSAMDFKNLLEGQKALGAVTGVAYKTITDSLVEATNGQLKYAEAAKAAAIGTASGLSPTQLSRLGSAAKNASVALGRDLGDSFDRLIRGVTKAEPELLDELGIILRLENATRKYGLEIGKSKDQLNEFERSQAVANEVLEQAERKFGAMEKLMDPTAHSLNQFAKAFDDIVNSLKVGIAGPLATIATFLSENILALTGAVSLFAGGLLKQVLPSMEAWKQSSIDTKNQTIRDQKAISLRLERTKKSYAKLKEARMNDADSAIKASKKITSGTTGGTKSGQGALDFLSGDSQSKRAQSAADKAIKHAHKQIEDGVKKRTGLLKDMNKKQVDDLRKSYNIRAGIHKKGMDDFSFHLKRGKMSMKSFGLSARAMSATVKSAFASMASAAATAGRLIGKAFFWLSILSIAFEGLKAVKDYFFPASEAAKKLGDENKKLSDKYSTLADEIERTNNALEDYSLVSIQERMVAKGNAAGSMDTVQLIKDVNRMATIDKSSEGYTDAYNNILALANEASALDTKFGSLVLALVDGTTITGEAKTALIEYSNGLQQTRINLEQLPAKANAANAAMVKLIGTFKKPFGTELIAANRLLASGSQKAADDMLPEITKNERKAFLRQKHRGPDKIYSEMMDSIEAEKKIYNELLNTAKTSSALADNLEKKQQKMVKLLKDQVDAAAELNKRKTLGLTTEGKLINLKLQEKVLLQSTNDEEVKKEVLLSSKAVLDAKKELSKEEAGQLELLKSQIEEQETIIAIEESKRDLGVERIKNETLLLELAERTSRRNEKDLSTSKKLLQIQNQIAFAKAGGTGTSGNIRGQEISTLTLAALQEQRQKALTAQDNAFDNFIANSSDRGDNFNNAVAQLDKADARVEKIENEIDVYKRRAEIIVLNTKAQTELLQTQISEVSLNPAMTAYNKAVNEAKLKGIELSLEQKAQLYAEIEAQTMLTTILENKTKLFEGIASSISSAFTSIVTGTASAKEAFKSMAISILSQISQMIIQMMVMRMLMSFFAGPMPMAAPQASSLGSNSSMVPSSLGGFMHQPNSLLSNGPRNGGVFSQGKRMQGYAAGGVARGSTSGYPAMLHGTEAVVPLPNGRSIPVEMKDSGATNNNIVVNVSTDGQTSREGSTGPDMDKLGGAIAQAVQVELQNQKRSGGILNPYGVA